MLLVPFLLPWPSMCCGRICNTGLQFPKSLLASCTRIQRRGNWHSVRRFDWQKSSWKLKGCKGPSALLRDLLQDLGWQKQQTPRECMALLLQNDRSELKAPRKETLHWHTEHKRHFRKYVCLSAPQSSTTCELQNGRCDQVCLQHCVPISRDGWMSPNLARQDWLHVDSISFRCCCQGLGTQASLLSAEDPFSMSRSSSPTSADHAKQVSIGWAVEPTEVRSSSCLFAGGWRQQLAKCRLLLGGQLGVYCCVLFWFGWLVGMGSFFEHLLSSQWEHPR